MSFFNAPKHACWDITSACNESCRFCYRVTGQRDLTLDAHLEIADKLASSGIRKVSIVGGEPLLVPHLPQLLRFLKSQGVSTSLVTNGILLQSRMNELAKDLDWVTLPLDGHNEATQVAMSRQQGHFSRVIDLAPKALKHGVRLKINSVVSSVNCHEIQELSECISALHPDRWKLFQFSPIRGAALKNAPHFSLPRNAFHDAVRPGAELAEKHEIHVTIADEVYLSGNYFSISPNGDVRVSLSGHDKVVGNLLTSNVGQIWRLSPFDHERHWSARRSIPEEFYSHRTASQVLCTYSL